VRLSRVHHLSYRVAFLALTACGDDARLSVGTQPMPAPLNTAEVRYRIEAGSLSRNAMTTGTLTAARARTRIATLEALRHEVVPRSDLAFGMMFVHVLHVPVVVWRADDRSHNAQHTTELRDELRRRRIA
jgi:hypothetical protein